MIRCKVVLGENSKAPSYGYESDAGKDFYASEKTLLYPAMTGTVPTGLKLQMDWDLPTEPLSVPVGFNPVESEIFAREIQFFLNQYFMQNFDPFLKLEGRSGLAHNNGLDVIAGVIDFGYTGHIGIVVSNNSKKGYVVEEGAKICQGVFHLRPKAIFEVVNEFDKLDKHNRGENGFGSTGN